MYIYIMPAVKNSVYAHFSGETREIVNGHVVKDRAVNTDYDGKILHIDKRNNNTISHYDIKDKQLKTLLLRPTSKINLLERLSRDYHEKTKSHNKKSRKKKSH